MSTANKRQAIPGEPIVTYHERKISKPLYRITSVYKGEINLGKTLEELMVRKILRGENSALLLC